VLYISIICGNIKPIRVRNCLQPPGKGIGLLLGANSINSIIPSQVVAVNKSATGRGVNLKMETSLGMSCVK
jgi:hypothetical protein